MSYSELNGGPDLPKEGDTSLRVECWT